MPVLVFTVSTLLVGKDTAAVKTYHGHRGKEDGEYGFRHEKKEITFAKNNIYSVEIESTMYINFTF